MSSPPRADGIQRIKTHLLPLLTRRKLFWFAVTLIVFGISLGGIDATPKPSVLERSEFVTLTLPPRSGGVSDAANAVTMKQGNIVMPAQDDEQWESVTVKPGQSLDAIFRKQGFSPALLHEILALNDETRSLKKIRPGDEFAFQKHDDGSMKRMRYAIDEDRWLIVDNNDGAPDYRTVDRPLSTQVVETEGTIRSSLFVAGKAAGLSDAMVMKLANIFGWDIDFVLDIREGDQFLLVYEKRYREGVFLRDGEILAATFVNQGNKFQAIRFESENGAHYFAPDGRNMRKAFLRAPLNFSYISSSFNPKRFHPILKRVKPHRGIDYRAPTGTPVYAAGDGKVIQSGYDGGNGHHVFIQHANSIVTKYLHFSRRSVKNGERVRQGQVIGLVGSTGLSQAPHLHYEFVVNGVHRNPRTVPLPKVDPLDGELLTRFQAHAAPYLTRLSRLEAASLYASRQ